MSRKHEPKTKGTVMAEKIREKTNRLSDEVRQQLLERARELIQGGQGKACAHRR